MKMRKTVIALLPLAITASVSFAQGIDSPYASPFAPAPAITDDMCQGQGEARSSGSARVEAWRQRSARNLSRWQC